MMKSTHKITARVTDTEEAFPYYLYNPCSHGKPSGVLVSVHGITRNALEHCARMAEFCAQNNFLLIAPYFSRDRFRYFQTLKADEQGARPSYALNTILDDAADYYGFEVGKILLVGYSGGGQFAHRYALCHPDRVAKLVISAAGWYTMPCPKTPYPEGLGQTNDITDLNFDIRAFSALPVSVLVGSKDTRRNSSLNKAPSIDKKQGRNRLARARSWIEAMSNLQETFGHAEPLSLKIVEDSGHDFTKNINDEIYYKALSAEILA